MNERIRLLAEQAGYKDLPTVRLAFQGFDKEKFALLIVRECVAIVRMNDDETFSEADGRARTILREIKEHFGVEE